MQLKKVSVNDIITAKYQMLKVRRGVRFNTAKKEKDIDSLARSIKMNGLLCPPSACSCFRTQAASSGKETQLERTHHYCFGRDGREGFGGQIISGEY